MVIAAIALIIGALVLAQRLVYQLFWNKHIGLEIFFSLNSERGGTANNITAVEGDSLLLTEVISNRKLLPLPWLAVKFQVSRWLLFTDMENARVSDDFYRNDLFNILPYRRITRRLPFVCGKRGVYAIKSAELVSGDVFNMLKLAMPASCSASLTVYPKLIDLNEVLTSHRQVLGQVLTKRFVQPDPFEFKGIREYQPYDSLRAINFNATAKTGEWMVNVNGFTVTQETVLLLNLAPYSAYPDDGLFEQTIRLAASLAVYYIENGVPVGIVTNGAVSGGTQTPAASGGCVSLRCGAAASHADNIRELLARIDLPCGAEIPCAEMLAEERVQYEAYKRSGRQRSYVLLSTDYKKEIMEGFGALVEAGAEALWLLPLGVGMEMKEKVPLAVTVRL